MSRRNGRLLTVAAAAALALSACGGGGGPSAPGGPDTASNNPPPCTGYCEGSAASNFSGLAGRVGTAAKGDATVDVFESHSAIPVEYRRRHTNTVQFKSSSAASAYDSLAVDVAQTGTGPIHYHLA